MTPNFIMTGSPIEEISGINENVQKFIDKYRIFKIKFRTLDRLVRHAIQIDFDKDRSNISDKEVLRIFNRNCNGSKYQLKMFKDQASIIDELTTDNKVKKTMLFVAYKAY